jgi:8-oxo-dGTP pyrophosphatase MutT (NUDIX family)
MKDLLDKMKRLNENKNGKVVTFDFDGTIIKSYEESNDGKETIYQYGGKNPQIIARIKKFKQSGTTVLVVTSRIQALEVPESSIQSMLAKFNINVDGVFYTNGNKKAQKLYELGSTLHYDDDPSEREAIEAYKNLHPSDIVVKNPDDLLKDIDEIAKGLILTNDNKIIIAQRSDSYEWDAPGGHLMEGEEANFAFYREVLEELSLKVKKIDYLASKDTVWKKKNKLVHYFVGRVPYNSDELEGVVQLQWEIADYFCGDLEEIEEKMGEGVTQNLRNVMELFGQEELMLERAYPHSDRHCAKKRRLVGVGGNTHTGAIGLKRVKKCKRSESAPAGYGVLEEKGEKPQKKIKISIISDLEEKKKRKKRKKKRKTRKKKAAMGIGWPYGGADAIGSHGDGDGGGDGGGE